MECVGGLCQPAPFRYDEDARLQILHSHRILDTIETELFDAVSRLAQTVFEVKIALVSLVDRDRQWFKSHQVSRGRANLHPTHQMHHVI